MRKNRKHKTYIVYAAMSIGGVLTGILLIPIGILAVMIYIIWAIINHIVRWCDKGAITEFGGQRSIRHKPSKSAPAHIPRNICGSPQRILPHLRRSLSPVSHPGVSGAAQLKKGDGAAAVLNIPDPFGYIGKIHPPKGAWHSANDPARD